MEYRITCIYKAVTEDSIAVTHVGGVDAQGERWKMALEEAGDAIAAGETFVLDDSPLRTIDPHSTQLLRLPSCPESEG